MMHCEDIDGRKKSWNVPSCEKPKCAGFRQAFCNYVLNLTASPAKKSNSLPKATNLLTSYDLADSKKKNKSQEFVKEKSGKKWFNAGIFRRKNKAGKVDLLEVADGNCNGGHHQGNWDEPNYHANRRLKEILSKQRNEASCMWLKSGIEKNAPLVSEVTNQDENCYEEFKEPYEAQLPSQFATDPSPEVGQTFPSDANFLFCVLRGLERARDGNCPGNADKHPLGEEQLATMKANEDFRGIPRGAELQTLRSSNTDDAAPNRNAETILQSSQHPHPRKYLAPPVPCVSVRWLPADECSVTVNLLENITVSAPRLPVDFRAHNSSPNSCRSSDAHAKERRNISKIRVESEREKLRTSSDEEEFYLSDLACRKKTHKRRNKLSRTACYFKDQSCKEDAAAVSNLLPNANLNEEIEKNGELRYNNVESDEATKMLHNISSSSTDRHSSGDFYMDPVDSRSRSMLEIHRCLKATPPLCEKKHFQHNPRAQHEFFISQSSSDSKLQTKFPHEKQLDSNHRVLLHPFEAPVPPPRNPRNRITEGRPRSLFSSVPNTSGDERNNFVPERAPLFKSSFHECVQKNSDDVTHNLLAQKHDRRDHCVRNDGHQRYLDERTSLRRATATSKREPPFAVPRWFNSGPLRDDGLLTAGSQHPSKISTGQLQTDCGETSLLKFEEAIHELEAIYKSLEGSENDLTKQPKKIFASSNPAGRSVESLPTSQEMKISKNTWNEADSDTRNWHHLLHREQSRRLDQSLNAREPDVAGSSDNRASEGTRDSRCARQDADDNESSSGRRQRTRERGSCPPCYCATVTVLKHTSDHAKTTKSRVSESQRLPDDGAACRMRGAGDQGAIQYGSEVQHNKNLEINMMTAQDTSRSNFVRTQNYRCPLQGSSQNSFYDKSAETSFTHKPDLYKLNKNEVVFKSIKSVSDHIQDWNSRFSVDSHNTISNTPVSRQFRFLANENVGKLGKDSVAVNTTKKNLHKTENKIKKGFYPYENQNLHSWKLVKTASQKITTDQESESSFHPSLEQTSDSNVSLDKKEKDKSYKRKSNLNRFILDEAILAGLGLNRICKIKQQLLSNSESEITKQFPAVHSSIRICEGNDKKRPVSYLEEKKKEISFYFSTLPNLGIVSQQKRKLQDLNNLAATSESEINEKFDASKTEGPSQLEKFRNNCLSADADIFLVGKHTDATEHNSLTKLNSDTQKTYTSLNSNRCKRKDFSEFISSLQLENMQCHSEKTTEDDMNQDIPGILKRSIYEPNEQPQRILKNATGNENEVQSILKKSINVGTSNLDSDLKPILKKRKNYEEMESAYVRSILKKKISTDDEQEDQLRSILKLKQQSLEDLNSDVSDSNVVRPILKKKSEEDLHSEDKPKSILKNCSLIDSSAFSSDDLTSNQKESCEDNLCVQHEVQFANKTENLSSKDVKIDFKTHVSERIIPDNNTHETSFTADSSSSTKAEEPCHLSIKEKIALYNRRDRESSLPHNIPLRKLRNHHRYTTQPVTQSEFAQISLYSILQVPCNHHCSKVKMENTVSTGKNVQIPPENNSVKKFSSDKISNPLVVTVEDIIISQHVSDKNCASFDDNQSVQSNFPEEKLGFGISARLNALRRSGDFDWRKRLNKIEKDSSLSNSPNLTTRVDALKQSGETEWMKRNINLKNMDTDFESEIEHDEKKKDNEQDEKLLKRRLRSERPASLKERIAFIEAHQEDWKQRIVDKDTSNFTVAGRMEKAGHTLAVMLTDDFSQNLKEMKQSIPKMQTFRSKGSDTSIQKNQNISDSEMVSDFAKDKQKKFPNKGENCIINVPNVLDETFVSFFEKLNSSSIEDSKLLVDLNVDHSKNDANSLLSSERKTFLKKRKVHRSKNPIRNLSQREDVVSYYVHSPVSLKQDQVNKQMITLQEIQNKTKEIKETTGVIPQKHLDNLMLIQIKGRRHVQIRLIEPYFEVVNSGDNYILITPDEVFYWVGRFSNVTERSRGLQLVKDIVYFKDLGIQADLYHMMNEEIDSNSSSVKKFWHLLGSNKPNQCAATAAHFEEDELYERAIVCTNMVYEYCINSSFDELKPVAETWGLIPKVQLLDENKVLIFDFGSEMYIWLGKKTNNAVRKSAMTLARDLWNTGYDYSGCDIVPFSASLKCGHHEMRAKNRPSWCLFAKINQNMETFLFKEKFDDWPHQGRLPGDCRKEDLEKEYKDVSADMNMVPYDIKLMLEPTQAHLCYNLYLNSAFKIGRGHGYFDKELGRYYDVSTSDIKIWRIETREPKLLSSDEQCHLNDNESYICLWRFNVSQKGHTLKGEISTHITQGKEQGLFFLWHGKRSNETTRGYAAKALTDLDTESLRQILIEEGEETPPFLNVFDGKLIILKDVYNNTDNYCFISSQYKLFRVCGSHTSEAFLIQIAPFVCNLRSRACFLLYCIKSLQIYLWYGSRTTTLAQEIAQAAALHLIHNVPKQINYAAGMKLTLNIIKENQEPYTFWQGLKKLENNETYYSLINSTKNFDYTPRLFHLTGITGELLANEIFCPCIDANVICAYPFLQDHLYNVSQPDNQDEIWLWQGWYEDRINSFYNQQDIQRRWDALRRVGFRTAQEYCHKKGGITLAKVVSAGLEPIEFQCLFPEWENKLNVSSINMQDGYILTESIDLDVICSRLFQTYSFEELQQRPLPDGVIPSMLESFLHEEDFEEVFLMSKDEFHALPYWKQVNKKKSLGLYI